MKGKLSPAKRPFNPTYEDMEAACRGVVTPLFKQILDRLDSIETNSPQLLTYPEIKTIYGITRHQIQKLVREGKITSVTIGRPRFKRSDLDALIQAPMYVTKRSAV